MPDQTIEDKIRAAIIEALKGIPELNGCLPGEITITTPTFSYLVEFYLPMPITIAPG
jgi:hypothetical protein